MMILFLLYFPTMVLSFPQNVNRPYCGCLELEDLRNVTASKFMGIRPTEQDCDDFCGSRPQSTNRHFVLTKRGNGFVCHCYNSFFDIFDCDEVTNGVTNVVGIHCVTSVLDHHQTETTDILLPEPQTQPELRTLDANSSDEVVTPPPETTTPKSEEDDVIAEVVPAAAILAILAVVCLVVMAIKTWCDHKRQEKKRKKVEDENPAEVKKNIN